MTPVNETASAILCPLFGKGSAMDEVLSITTVAGTTGLTPDADDPLVARRDQVTRELLRDAIRALPAEERTALRLAARDGRPLAAIADALGRSPAEAEAVLRDGMLNLRTTILAQLEG